MEMFEIIDRKNNKRFGKLHTKNGVVNTPFFMPDATRGFVRSLSRVDLKKLKMGPMVVNTYHLYLQPGLKIIKKSGGLHKFMNWKGPLLSDSGGYQVFSLIHKNPQMGKITDSGVVFRSPLDGSTHKLTPEKSIQIQFDLGVDMMVCLDDPPPNNYSKDKIASAVKRTIRWAQRCMVEYKKQIKLRKIEEQDRPLIFCVIQGGEYLDLRKYCAEELIKINSSTEGGPALSWDGYGFGARPVDAEGNFLEKILRTTAELIPENAIRFALGIGTPQDIIRCFSYGWDMFDCVIPTREGRHGRLFLRKNYHLPLHDIFSYQTGKEKNKELSHSHSVLHAILSHKQKKESGNIGKDFCETININNKKYKNDFSSVDPYCDCELCQNYTRAYLHHLFAVKELSAMRLASIHNLKLYLNLMEELKQVKNA